MKLRIVIFLLTALCGLGTLAIAQQTQVPIMVKADGGFDTCAVGEIIKASAVRAGPGIGYRKIDTLKVGNHVWMFDDKGDWVGVAYGSDEIECSPVKKDKAYDGPGKSGWVQKKYVRLMAG